MELTAMICEDARVAHDGRLQLTGVFNELHAPAFPARQDRLVLVAVLLWDAGEQGRVEFRIDLEDPDGVPVYTIDGHSEVGVHPGAGSPPKTQLVLPLHDVMFPRAGRYRFALSTAHARVPGPSLYLCAAKGVERL